jgi:DNA-binding NarL/FixJ family response regulator
MKLLIADDHAGVRKFVRELVAELAAEICECANGEEAVRLCVEFLPDFVIMDLQMPGMDGFEATRRLVDECPRAWVIAISHAQHPGFEKRARQAGARWFLNKEDLSELSNCIKLLAKV